VRIRLEGVTKRFGEVEAVRALDLEVPSGELFTLIGPSGCGKTTTLRMVAGLEAPSAGTIRFGDRAVADPARGVAVPAQARHLGMVFQSYALWPHLSVADNCALGLRTRGLTAAATRHQVQEALAMVGLEAMAQRYPHQLSGGQQQRVALARAVALQPQLLLFDEPLSNLDAALHEQICTEIRALQRRLAITTLYVTHNQAEAMIVADRIGVMRDGALLQMGTPQDIYERPRDEFVAGFFGKANLLRGQARDGRVQVGGALLEVAAPLAGGPVSLLLRPEAVRFDAIGANRLEGEVRQALFLGAHVEYEVRVDALDATLRALVPSAAPAHSGRVVLTLPPERLLPLGRQGPQVR
jgi:ABC-type Fe3+/spermidine/putrescine transport system ATPase subunit